MESPRQIYFHLESFWSRKSERKSERKFESNWLTLSSDSSLRSSSSLPPIEILSQFINLNLLKYLHHVQKYV